MLIGNTRTRWKTNMQRGKGALEQGLGRSVLQSGMVFEKADVFTGFGL
jgi:hypothetical protein